MTHNRKQNNYLGFRRCGSLTVARTDDRVTQLRRQASRAKAFGIEAEIITPKEAGEKMPCIRTDDLKAALWLPADGTATSSDLTASLAAGAKQRGVRIFEKTRVTAITKKNGRVTGVTTSKGHIDADIVINCGGQWARRIGQLAGIVLFSFSTIHFPFFKKRNVRISDA